MPFAQPLIELGISYATGRTPASIDEDTRQKLEIIFTEFLTDPAGTAEAQSLKISHLGFDGSAIQRLVKILAAEPGTENSVAKKKAGPSDPQHRDRSPPWSTEEDERLIAGIYHYGLSDWQHVSMFVGNGRSRAQCGQRWLRCINPNMRKDKWTAEEDAALMKLVEKYGTHAWSKIGKEFGNRTDVQCRYRYFHHICSLTQSMPGIVPEVGMNVLSLGPPVPIKVGMPAQTLMPGIRMPWGPELPTMAATAHDIPVIPISLDEKVEGAHDSIPESDKH